MLEQAILAAECHSKMDATIAGEPTVVKWIGQHEAGFLMRRPHVYERSIPRMRRETYQEPAGDPAIVAQAIARTLPAMIQDAEDAGLTIVADHLTRALEATEVRSAKHEPHWSASNEPGTGDTCTRARFVGR